MSRPWRKRKGSGKRPAWTPFVETKYPPEHAALLRDSKGFVGVFRNSRYQVEMYEIRTALGVITWLAIVAVDRAARHDWREFQRIKNELCGPEREGCELYPAESRLVDTSNQYHVFVLPPGQVFPWGYAERDIGSQRAIDEMPGNVNRQRPFERGAEPDDVDARRSGDNRIAVWGQPAHLPVDDESEQQVSDHPEPDVEGA